MRKYLIGLFLFTLALVLAVPEFTLESLKQLVDAVRSGDWREALALGLVGGMWAATKLKLREMKFFAGDRGGAILVMLMAMGGAVSTALLSDATLDWKLFLTAGGVAWTAVGGYTWIKRVFWPKDK